MITSAGFLTGVVRLNAVSKRLKPIKLPARNVRIKEVAFSRNNWKE